MSIQEALECIETLEARAEYARAWYNAAESEEERNRALRAACEYEEQIERIRAEMRL